jgi:hypothetical protein
MGNRKNGFMEETRTAKGKQVKWNEILASMEQITTMKRTRI